MNIASLVSMVVTESSEELLMVDPKCREKVLLARRCGRSSELDFVWLDAGGRKVSSAAFYGKQNVALILEGREDCDLCLLPLEGVETVNDIRKGVGTGEVTVLTVGEMITRSNRLPLLEAGVRLCVGVERGVAAVSFSEEKRVVVLDMEVDPSSSDEEGEDEDEK
eukprot:m.140169 g.140169  ORF g.140169 m.140169 type:complete len:165 (+) comp38295_c0_seq2:1606-2100(+)